MNHPAFDSTWHSLSNSKEDEDVTTESVAKDPAIVELAGADVGTDTTAPASQSRRKPTRRETLIRKRRVNPKARRPAGKAGGQRPTGIGQSGMREGKFEKNWGRNTGCRYLELPCMTRYHSRGTRLDASVRC